MIGSPRSIAARSAGLSARRRSSRNHTIDGRAMAPSCRGGGPDPGLDRECLAELVAVELDRTCLVRRELDAGAARVDDGAVLRAQRQHSATGAEAAQEAVVPRDPS